MKYLKSILIFVLLSACTSAEDQAATFVAATAEQQQVIAEAIAATQTASVTDTPYPTDTLVPTSTPVPTETLTATPIPTETATVRPTNTPFPTRPTSTPDVAGSWRSEQLNYNLNTEQDCDDMTTDPDVYLHFPADPNNTSGWCSLAIFVFDRNVTLVFRPDTTNPPQGSFPVNMAIFQADEADNKLLDIVATLVGFESVSQFNNYTLVYRDGVSLDCSDGNCLGLIDSYQLDTDLAVTCAMITFFQPVYFTVFCTSTGLFE